MDMKDSGSAVLAQGLAKSFGDQEALRGVSFEVAFGEVFAYLGRNGSGKTTTVRLLTGLTAPSRGAAWVAGRDLDHLDRSSIGVTMQSAALDPSMSGREHLAFLAGFWGFRGPSAREAVAESLERFGLSEAGNRLIHTYSGGMKRRLDLAGALLHRPEVLFLDEPTTGLDAQSRRALWSEVQSLRDEGTALFLTTQYLEEADELADRVAILKAGRLVALGTPDELRARAGSVELQIESQAGMRIELPDGRSAVADRRGTLRVPFHDVDVALETLARIRPALPSIRGATVQSPTLEDVFLQVTGEPVSDAPVALATVA
jgi:ABC-2 type transport system ATP-binding protein